MPTPLSLFVPIHANSFSVNLRKDHYCRGLDATAAASVAAVVRLPENSCLLLLLALAGRLRTVRGSVPRRAPAKDPT